MDYIDSIFGQGGYLSQHQEHYEVREGQVQLACAVHNTLEKKQQLLAEAPCGSGKGFAYLVPVIHQIKTNKRRTVIATANIALQVQLIEKDIPTLQKALPIPFTAALLKGRGNFLCPRKVDLLEVMRDGYIPGTDAYNNYGLNDKQGTMLCAILSWAAVTETGDREENGFPCGAGEAWQYASCAQDECVGGACHFRKECWSEIHRAEAFKANIIVTNYNLLFAHAHVRAKTSKDQVLPKFHCLIMDEAHEAVRIARDFFGSAITFRRFKRINEWMKRELKLKNTDVTDQGRHLMQAVAVYAKTSAYRVKKRLTEPDVIDCRDALGALVAARHKVVSIEEEICPSVEAYQGLDDESKEQLQTARTILRNIDELAKDVKEAFQDLQDEKVYWIKIEKKRPIRVEARHLDVAEIFHTKIFPLAQSSVLTSATLTAMGTFDLIRTELGVTEDAAEFVAESPFDFCTDARLVVPDKTTIAPASENRELYNSTMLGFYQQMLDLWPGRVLCLFTALTDLDWTHKHLDGYKGRTFYKQGEFPRPLLTEWFRQDEGSVLMGVDSFWTGVDVPGPKMIIIHKLPFPYQDVVLKAIRSTMSTGEWLTSRYYPWMITRLRQGIGRLLRRTGDYGVVVCLDRRMTDKWAYSHYIGRSLPFEYCIRTDELELLQPFLEAYANDQIKDDHAIAV